MQITLNTRVLLGLLKENKEKHIEEYELQVQGWKVAMEKFSLELKQWSDNGGSEERPKEPFKPKDYTDEYDRYIDYLENHRLDTVDLEEWEYKQLFKDEWGWKQQFSLSSATYNGLING